MTGTQTPLQAVQAELAAAMYPWPDDVMDDLTPQAGLVVLRQTAMQCLRMVTDAAGSLAADGNEEQPTISEVLNGVAAAVAGATHALVALGVLPAEAEQALEVGHDNVL
jgi:hypothetical protein